jgi:hypothetical protein
MIDSNNVGKTEVYHAIDEGHSAALPLPSPPPQKQGKETQKKL